MSNDGEYNVYFSPEFDRAIKKLNKTKPDIVRELVLYFSRLERNPELGKPLRNRLRGYRRLHIAGSFVLMYEVRNHCVYLIDFDHHDRIYKKYS